MPLPEIQDTLEVIKLRMELPSIEPNDLDVKVTVEAVAIQGERKSKIKQDDKSLHRLKFRYSSPQRVIPLPTRVQND